MELPCILSPNSTPTIPIAPPSGPSITEVTSEVVETLISQVRDELDQKRAEMSDLHTLFGRAIGDMLDTTEARAVLDRHPEVWSSFTLWAFGDLGM